MRHNETAKHKEKVNKQITSFKKAKLCNAVKNSHMENNNKDGAKATKAIKN